MNINNHPQANDLYTGNLRNQPSEKASQLSSQAKAGNKPVEDTLELSKLEALRKEPEIRPEVVEKGKALLNDPNYPSQEMVDAIAKLIVPFDDDE